MSDQSTAGDWLTISEAAQVLGISERQARRYARKLEESDRLSPESDAGHHAGHVSGLSPARVRLSAMVEARARATGKAQSTSTEHESSVEGTPVMEPDTRPDQAGHVLPDAGHEAGHVAALLSQKDAHIADLRKQVDFLQERNAELNAIIMRHAHALPMPATAEKMGSGDQGAPVAPVDAVRPVQGEVLPARHADRVGLRGWLLRMLRG